MADKSQETNIDVLDYQLIEFISRGRKPSTKTIDIVPRSWIIHGKKKVTCRFPPGPDYSGLHEMVKNLVNYEESWPTFNVHIRGQACMYRNFLYFEFK